MVGERILRAAIEEGAYRGVYDPIDALDECPVLYHHRE